jgi:tRNA G10  N-methylase Trm11
VGTAQWQYILPNQRKAKTIHPLVALNQQINMIENDLIYMQNFAVNNYATLLRGDARNLEQIPDDFVDLVITSPPYINNYDYADATRLEMTFCGEVNS